MPGGNSVANYFEDSVKGWDYGFCFSTTWQGYLRVVINNSVSSHLLF
ncbi:hypothetical protein IIA29_13255 [candidate division KSB1 bacterium]|nr:hypothetical protein [candidate division KSB1 bacterium]